MNTILVVLDTWRRDHSGCYGNEWIHTPNINRFAEKSAVFENAYLASYPTLPCRRDIATGRYEFPWRGWGGLEPDDTTLAGVINDVEKVSYFMTDIYHHWSSNNGSGYWRPFTGFDIVRGQERDKYITDSDIEFDNRSLGYPPHVRAQEPHFRNVQYIRQEERDWFSPQLFSRAARWIQHNADHEDFFLMIDSFDPHEPWDPPRHYINMYADPGFDGKEYVVAPYGPVDENLTEAELKHVQALYAGEISMADRWFGYFMEQVERMGLMENTMIILTTDHGTHNGSHGRTGKNWVLWDEISHIPLIIWHPEFGQGTRPRQFAQPIDYFPTVLEVAGLEAPDGLHGQSLIPWLKDPSAEDNRDAILFGFFGGTCNLTDGEYVLFQGVEFDLPLYSYSSIIANRKAFNWNSEGKIRCRAGGKFVEERDKTRLYHIPSDPGQENNIAETHPEKLLRMQKLMVRKLGEIDAPAELLTRFGLGKI
jgi:arylsulfatase A-like enzyme